MRIGKWARVLLAAVPFLTSCGNFWQPPSGGGGGGGGGGTATGTFFALNETSAQIFGYTIASSKLTAVTGSPYAVGTACYSLAVSPNKKLLFVGTLAGIFAYTIDSSTGALTQANSGSAISQDFATTMQVDSTNKWLLVAGPNHQLVYAIPINSTTGALGTGGEEIAGLPAANVQQIAISPDNANVFVALGTNGTVIIPFTAGNSNPLGTRLPTIAVNTTNGSALSVAVDPQNRVFYIGETLGDTAGTAGGLRVFNYVSIATGTLVEATGSPYVSGGLAPNVILPGAAYTYVGNGAGSGAAGNVAEFTVSASGTGATTTATLTAGATIATGITPSGLAIESTGTYLLAVASGGTPDLTAYKMSSGTLTSTLTSALGTDPALTVAVAAGP